MAPTETQKRKRGRPAGSGGTSQADASATTRRSGLRGHAEPADEHDGKQPRKRARRTAVGGEAAHPSSDESSRRKSMRDRNSGDSSSWWQTGDDQPAGVSKAKAAKAAKVAKTAKTAKKGPAAKSPSAKRPGRPSLTAGGKARKPGRPSLEAGAKAKRPGRPRTSNVSPRAATAAASTPSSARAKKRRKRSSQGGEDGAQPPDQDGPDADADADADATPLPPYRQLVARTRLIPLATMTSKWAPLERGAVDAVQSLLAECARPVLSRARMGGGAAAHSERCQEQARLAIAAVTRRLRSKLIKGIPFPPSAGASGSGRRRSSAAAKRQTRRDSAGSVTAAAAAAAAATGHEADFDFEKTVEGVQALEHQLNPLQHAILLLERQRAREERALEADYAALRQLQTNAQAETRSWRERVRRSHALAPPADGGGSGSGGRSDSDRAPPQPAEFQAHVELAKRRPADGDGGGGGGGGGGIFENADKELLALAAQLGNHMDSLKGNLQQIEGVVPAITRSKAALQHVLHQRLDARQYERIVLGQ